MKRDMLLMACQNSRWLLFCLVSLAVLGIGCTKGFVSHTRLTPTGLAPEDAIAVIQVQSWELEYSDKLEKKLVGCIKDVLEDTHPTVRIVPPKEFRGVAFPDLTPEEVRPKLEEGFPRPGRDVDSGPWGTSRDPALDPAGDSSWDWDQLAKDPAFATRIAPLDLRYLIIVSGGTTTDSKFGASLACGGSGCLPVWWVNFDKFSNLYATIIDLKQGREAGIVSAFASGKATWLWPPAPLVFPTFPEGRACSELGEGVAGFLEETLPAVPEETLPAVTEETFPARIEEFLPAVPEETLPAMTKELGTSIGKAEEDDCWPPCLCSDQSC